MDSYMIIGAFGKMGFEFCNQLLNHGVPVYHVNLYDELENNVEDKKMMIGRNSNFQNIEGSNVKNLSHEGYLRLLLPFYDWNEYEKEVQEIVISRLENFLSEIIHEPVIHEYTLLLPNQLEKGFNSLVENFFFRRKEMSFQTIVLPNNVESTSDQFKKILSALVDVNGCLMT